MGRTTVPPQPRMRWSLPRRPVLSLVVFFALALPRACSAPGDPPPEPETDPPLFVEVTTGRIARDGGASRGVGWADFDEDGDPDLAVANTSGQWNALYLDGLRGARDDWRDRPGWRGTGESPASGAMPGRPAPTEESAAAGGGRSAAAAGPPGGSIRPVPFVKASDPDLSPLGAVGASAGRAEGVAWVDLDGDGDLDLHMVTRGTQPDLLFENRGPEGLVRVTEGPLVRPASSTMACWADVDGDGRLDVFLVRYRGDGGDALFRNLGGGRFEEARDSPVAGGSGAGRACAWGDPDGDGLPDLYVGNAREPNEFFRNRGGFELERETGDLHLVRHVGYTYGLSWADFDGDGSQDLFVANFDTVNVLYRNDGSGGLEPVREGPVAEETGGASKGHAWGDFDLDGDLDLFVANGTYGPDMRSFLYLNRGDGRFHREERGAFATHADTSAGAAWADYDRDGDLDLFVANWGSADQVNRLYRNTTSETTGRSWVAFRLRSPTPDTRGWGAKVRAKATIGGEGRWMTRWNVPTTGYGSQNELLVHFGLGDARAVDSLVVEWPSGSADVHTEVEGRRFWTVVEGGGLEARGRRTFAKEPSGREGR